MLSTLLAGTDTLFNGSLACSQRQVFRREASVCTFDLCKTDAEDLLDWLENNGCHDYELCFEPGTGFRVTHR